MPDPGVPLIADTSNGNDFAAQVVWSESRRLTWEDFKALPDNDNPHHALTAANLAVNAKCKDGKFTYIVNCVFLPEQSWTKNNSSEKLLAHEQLHFDLTEVHARQLRRDLEALSCGTLKASLNPTVANAFKNWKAEQDAFDKACRHGLDKQEQLLWAQDITQRLHSLEMYR
ncbi:DUF922 domain-containing protein [Pontibacter oryzae]|nr:DUF922 domain-containing protein [Pontibacter oryzae]